MIATATFDPRRMQAAADAETTAATDLAEWLVRAGMPFRDAHAVVGALVRRHLDGEGSLRDLVAARSGTRRRGGGARRPRCRRSQPNVSGRRRSGGVPPPAASVRHDAPPRTRAPLPDDGCGASRPRRSSPATRSSSRPTCSAPCSASGRVAGRIAEVEAYRRDDPASHSFRGPTPRNASMFGRPATLYVYFSYGIHCCANVVTGDPATVRLCCCVPQRIVEGEELVAARRAQRSRRESANGPGKLCQAFGIDLSFDGLDLATDERMWIEPGSPSTTRTSRPASASPSPSTSPGAGSSLARAHTNRGDERVDVGVEHELGEPPSGRAELGRVERLARVRSGPRYRTSWVSRQSGAEAASSAGEDERLARESSMA